jgi:flagellin-specific chaperone FliS
LNDEFDQLSSSSQSFFLLDALLKVLSTFKKRFHRRSISLQSISLNYALISENQHAVKYLQSIQQFQKIITLFDDSSVSALSAANFARTKRKVKETREETTNEKISRMNRIIKTNLRKMLNVTMIANIAVVVATISQTTSQVIAAATVSVTNTRLER